MGSVKSSSALYIESAPLCYSAVNNNKAVTQLTLILVTVQSLTVAPIPFIHLHHLLIILPIWNLLIGWSARRGRRRRSLKPARRHLKSVRREKGGEREGEEREEDGEERGV